MVTLEDVLYLATKNKRICPMPDHWHRLYSLLPDRQPRELAPPLILAAWYTPWLFKMIRLREHIEWAAEHGALEVVHNFLVSLREEDWYHSGE